MKIWSYEKYTQDKALFCDFFNMACTLKVERNIKTFAPILFD